MEDAVTSRLPERLGDVIKRHPEYLRMADKAELPPGPEPKCPRCRDGGYLRRDLPATHPDFGRLVACECRRAELTAQRVARFWARSQAPTRYASCTLESYPGDPSVAETLRAWLETDDWLMLEGEYGAGKTALAVALLRILAEQGVSVLFVNAPAMLRRVRSTFSHRPDADDDEAAVVDSLGDVDVLAIDDVGKERLTEWGSELLYDVVNRRYSDGRRTIVTTNLGVDQLEAHLGGATFWRLFERSQLVHLSGNLRRRAR